MDELGRRRSWLARANPLRHTASAATSAALPSRPATSLTSSGRNSIPRTAAASRPLHAGRSQSAKRVSTSVCSTTEREDRRSSRVAASEVSAPAARPRSSGFPPQSRHACPTTSAGKRPAQRLGEKAGRRPLGQWGQLLDWASPRWTRLQARSAAAAGQGRRAAMMATGRRPNRRQRKPSSTSESGSPTAGRRGRAEPGGGPPAPATATWCKGRVPAVPGQARPDVVPSAQALDDLGHQAEGERGLHRVASSPDHEDVVTRPPARLLEDGRLPEPGLPEEKQRSPPAVPRPAMSASPPEAAGHVPRAAAHPQLSLPIHRDR